MKRFIRSVLLVLLLIVSSLSGQIVFAADYDLNTDIYNHLENWDTEFEIPYYKSDALDLVQSIAKKDDYLSLSLKKIVYERVGKSVTLKVTYKTTKEQEEYVNQELTQIISNIIKDNMSGFEKVRAINEYLVGRFEYDDSLVSNNAYSALATGKTTCQGYALAACKMLNLVDIENRIVIGSLDGVPHGWNLVKLNNKWYQLDVTSNDALSNNKFFLRKDSILKNNGFTWDSSKYPECDEDYAVGWNLINDKWYFFDNNDGMKTGWIYYKDKWYYCYTSTGVMASNTVIDGYRVGSSGAWIS